MATFKTWYEAYSNFAKVLDEFYISNRENPAKALYDTLSLTEYKRLNPANIFQSQIKIEEHGFDPIQIFASFNYSRISKAFRIEIINCLFKALQSNHVIANNVSFEGIPGPIIARIVQYRGLKSQNEIWEISHNVVAKGIEGLKENSFNSLENWSGIDIASFTMFLFWINSEQFLPLDRNTVKFLSANSFIIDRPRRYEEYLDLCTNRTIYVLSKSKDKNEAFRNIVGDAYKFSDKEYKNDILSGSTVTIITRPSDEGEKMSQEELEERLKREKIDSERNFKIIAIRPLAKENKKNENDTQKHLKNLTEGQLYQFHREYKFEDITDKIIDYDKTKEINFYNYPGSKEKQSINISVSAIVGKNGSGKSALVELIYLVVNKLAFFKGIESSEELVDEEVYADLFVKADRLYKISVGKNVVINSYDVNSEGNSYSQADNDIADKFNIARFCYSIVVNYSLYGLNSNIMGEWIDPLFHKNDSYQVPIVLNPKRDEGRIDVNNEEHLTKSRLLSNIVEPRRVDFKNNKVREILPGKVPSKLSLVYDKYKMERKREYYFKKYELNPSPDNINKVIEQFGIKEIKAKELIEECKEYIFFKLDSIAENYPKQFGHYLKLIDWIDDADKLKNYCDALDSHTDHITIKLKQALNYLRYGIYYPEKENTIIDLAGEIDTLMAEEKNNETEKGLLKNKNKLKTIDLVPPSFFIFKIYFENDSEFSELSSGEKQQIFSINSITYQLYNINSVMEPMDKDIYKYSNANIIFDEVELYFHPDMQRTYIDVLRERIIDLDLDYLENINIIFVTHSPFILSDIPNTNILKLENGAPKPYLDDELTFGANVHDLLANDFYLNDGFMGEFAKSKINQVISSLRYKILLDKRNKLKASENTVAVRNDLKIINLELKQIQVKNIWTNNDCLNLIALVGEQVLRESLEDLYYEAFSVNEQL